MLKRCFLILLSLIICLPLFTIGTLGSEIGENIPTIFIGNDAWYKYKIQPLVSKDGESLIPLSVFSAFENLSISTNDAYNSLLIASENGDFLSVNTKNGKYITHDEIIGNISTLLVDKEYYISAKIAADCLGLGFEEAVFYDKYVVRLYKDTELQPLDILIDTYIGSDALLPNAVGSGAGTVKRYSTFSTVVDISNASKEAVETLIEAGALIRATMTFAIDEKFISDKKNIPILLNIAANGHSFAISLMNESSLSDEKRIELCNDFLSTLFKKKTFLILTQNSSTALSEMGFILLNTLQSVSTINIGSFNFGNNKTIFLDSTEMITISKFVAIADSAAKNDRYVVAVNQLAGN